MAVQLRAPYESGKESFEYVAYEGLVVAVESTYMGDGDSNYFAVVWDEGQFVNVGASYTGSEYKVDAPDDLKALYTSLKDAQRVLASVKYSMLLRHQQEEAERREQFVPSRGKVVTVVKGRKVPVSTVGTVKVNCEGQWGRRVLLVTADGTEHWVSESNVEVDLAASAAATSQEVAA